MDSACFNCGSSNHFYFECVATNSVDGKFRKESLQHYLKANPIVNQLHRLRQFEREEMKKEGQKYPLPLILEYIEKSIDQLIGMKQSLHEKKIKIFVFQRIINLDLYLKMHKELDKILPEIRMLTCYSVSHLRHADMNFLEKQLLYGKQEDLRELRDDVSKAINAALKSVDKFSSFMSNRNYDVPNNPRPENQVDLKKFVKNIAKISNHVEIYGADEDGYWASGNDHLIKGYLY